MPKVLNRKVALVAHPAIPSIQLFNKSRSQQHQEQIRALIQHEIEWLIQSVGEAVPYPIAHPVTEGKVAYLKCLRDVEMESTLSEMKSLLIQLLGWDHNLLIHKHKPQHTLQFQIDSQHQ